MTKLFNQFENNEDGSKVQNLEQFRAFVTGMERDNGGIEIQKVNNCGSTMTYKSTITSMTDMRVSAWTTILQSRALVLFDELSAHVIIRLNSQES